MLPRRSLLVSLLASLALLAAATALESTLTVDITDADAVNATHTAPPVCNVTFILGNYTIRNEICLISEGGRCTVDVTTRDILNAVFTREGFPDITFNITFVSTMSATCSRYIPRIRYESETSRTVQCIPIFSCNALVSGTVPVQWWRFDSKSVRERVLESGGNSEPQYLLRNTTPFLINDSEHTLEIGFPSTKYSVVGYYATMFRLNGQNVTGQQFTVYSNPELAESSGDEEVIFGRKEAKDFTRIFCQFVSFPPPANITWEAPSGSNFNTTDTGEALEIGSEHEPTLSVGGRLRFGEVQYEDGGEYKCTARHPLSGEEESHTIRLRVRDPLRPLWPSLGILGSFLLTALFIAGGALVDKIRGKKASDDDDGSFQRNYSIVSNLGDEQGSSDPRRKRKHQSVEKRISITQQELLPNAEDPN